MVRNTHLAEDVTQGVFVAAAQSARQLVDCSVLPGWLHRTTQNLAANVVRSDVRRRAREQEAAVMNELLSVNPDANWEHIALHLDAALGELSEPDRDAVLLRYFKNHDLRTVGATLGISDDAAQKRVSRAVERLREFFAKRGITVGASGLAVVISANAVQAAPVGLALTISTATALAGKTLATTATATAIKTIAMTTLQKTVITATVAILAGTGIYEARQAARLREQNQTLQQQAPLAGQIQQLQRERDDATNRLAALQGENERLKSGQTLAELLKLRGEVGVLRRQSVSSETKTKPLFAMAQLMNDPQTKEYLRQENLRRLKEQYGPLFKELKLTPEEVEKFIQLHDDQWLKASEVSLALAAKGNVDREETLRAMTEQAMAEAYKEFENQLRSLLGDAGYARYIESNNEIPGRATVKQLDSQLGDNRLSDDQRERLIQLIKAEPYRGVVVDASQEDLDKYFQQHAETDQRIVEQAASFLSPQQLAGLATMQSNNISQERLSLAYQKLILKNPSIK
ncbi:MAG: hypothetical protein QOD03_1721 [Verrucomicrobiota bacterium]